MVVVYMSVLLGKTSEITLISCRDFAQKNCVDWMSIFISCVIIVLQSKGVLLTTTASSEIVVLHWLSLLMPMLSSFLGYESVAKKINRLWHNHIFKTIIDSHDVMQYHVYIMSMVTEPWVKEEGLYLLPLLKKSPETLHLLWSLLSLTDRFLACVFCFSMLVKSAKSLCPVPFLCFTHLLLFDVKYVLYCSFI